MPKTKISEFSATPGNNTDIDGINISEGCPPSGINDAIRELMAQLKDFQAGTAGDSFNGPVGTTTPAAGAFTNLSASGTFALTGDQVQISEGGTGQTTANAAFNALAPSQSTHAGKYLKTDGTNTSWDALDISTADITGTLPIANGGTGLTALGTGVQTALGQNVTGSGGIVLASSPSLTTPNLGTPSAVTLTNATGLPLSTGVTGTLATTNGGTGLTSFTANGVVYASSSSALTTGSALSFDGTNLSSTGGATFQGSPTGFSGGEVRLGPTTANLQNAISTQSTGTPELFFDHRGTGNLGMFVWRIGTGGSNELARLTSTGLGIGTSSPRTKLDVRGNGIVGGVAKASADSDFFSFSSSENIGSGFRLGVSRSAAGSGAYYSLQVIEDGVGYRDLSLQPISGNLGIGTSSPGTKLDVYNSQASGISEIARFRWNNGGTGGAITFANQAGTVLGQIANSTDSNGSPLEFSVYNNSTALTKYMTLSGSGNLGLGVTPSAWVGLKAIDLNGAHGGSFASSNGSTSVAINSYFNGTNWIYKANGDATRYEQLGGLAGTSSHAWYTAPSGTAGNAISFTQAMTLDASGNFLVGTTTATVGTAVGARIVDGGARLEVASAATTNANIGLSQYSTGAASYRFYVGYDGTVYATNTTISAISDQRFKENIVDLDVGLNAVMALKPRKFDWKEGKGKDIKGDRGFIAQEFEQVFPDLIDEWRDPAPEGEEPYKSVRQDLIPVLVKAIQEQQAIITDLRARVAQLEAK